MQRKRDSSPDPASGDDGDPPPGGEFEVFLNFRGPDTRLSFTDCLYHAMDGAGVRVFRDEEEIRKGEEIGGELLRAINNSKVYVTVFSRDYASSAWCLRELARIVECCRGSSGKVILPIFYDVGAYDVKLRTGLYDEALKKHEGRFSCDEVRRWKEALVEVARIKGWGLKGKGEGAVIKHVVDEVLTRLKKRQRNLPDHLVGIHDHLEDVTRLLQEGSLDVRFVVIHGMGGIGKTTLAEAVFNRVSHQFSGHSFLSNVRESSQDDQIRELQWRLLSDILKFQPKRIYDTNDGISMIKERFRHKKVLIVLDDVDNRNQLMKLAGKQDWFGPGSRIIITTRDIGFLPINRGRLRDSDSIPQEEFYIYKMKEMPLDHALELFSKHAFRRDTPPHDYYKIATKIVKTTGGLPLALKVIGSSLCYKSEAVWEDMLEKLMKMPNREVHDILMISYEMLEYEQQQIFLDIACHMAGEQIDDAILMWKSCEFFPNHAIDVLINMSLIRVVYREKLWMHDQLRDLGREIVRRESIQFPGKRSRLWCPRLAMEVICRKKGTKKIVALKLDGHSKSHNFTPEEFSKLESLRFLELDGGNFVGDFESLFSDLRWLSWRHCPSEFQATNFCLSNLVVLKISASDIINDWDGWSQIMGTSNLKVLSLVSCKSLIKTPDFSMCSTLERLLFKDCESLVQIDPSIGNQEHLQYLEMSGCNRFGSLLKEASTESSPCVVPQFLPDSMGNLKFLTTLKMENLALFEVPASIGKLKSLLKLELGGTKMTGLPHSIGDLKMLRKMSLSMAPIKKLPNSIGGLESLIELNLEYTNITELPACIGNLKRLEILCLDGSAIRELPRTIGMLENLKRLEASCCKSLKGEIPSEIGGLCFLRTLNLSESKIRRLPTTMNQLSHLQQLNLNQCDKLKQLPELSVCLKALEFPPLLLWTAPNLSYLTTLVDLHLWDDNPWLSKLFLRPPKIEWIEGLSSLERLVLVIRHATFPLINLATLSRLRTLEITCVDPQSLMGLPSSLEKLSLFDVRLPMERSLFSNLTNLSNLDLCNCRLREVNFDNVLGQQLVKLHSLSVSDGEYLERLTVSILKGLRSLRVTDCPRLMEIQGAEKLGSLEALSIYKCSCFERLPDLSELKELRLLSLSYCPLQNFPDPRLEDTCFLTFAGCGNLPYFIGDYKKWKDTYGHSGDDTNSQL
ncbi:disease resistance protein RPV1-like [Syzygium oleosum]|uniref:disease resistance protein RPV1-like n=1 Tax=Syzygium oleosum TaxID=219896 RepID=UPI0011D204D5|nr:disease resistance protein RPV1-like [Syzygium oleosum]